MSILKYSFIINNIDINFKYCVEERKYTNNSNLLHVIVTLWYFKKHFTSNQNITYLVWKWWKLVGLLWYLKIKKENNFFWAYKKDRARMRFGILMKEFATTYQPPYPCKIALKHKILLNEIKQKRCFGCDSRKNQLDCFDLSIVLVHINTCQFYLNFVCCTVTKLNVNTFWEQYDSRPASFSSSV